MPTEGVRSEELSSLTPPEGGHRSHDPSERTPLDVFEDGEKITAFFRALLDTLPDEFDGTIPYMVHDLSNHDVSGILERLADNGDNLPIVLSSFSLQEREKLYRHVTIFSAQPQHGFRTGRKILKALLECDVDPNISTEYIKECLECHIFGFSVYEDVCLFSRYGFDFAGRMDDLRRVVRLGMDSPMVKGDLEIWKEKTRWVLEFFAIPEEEITAYITRTTGNEEKNI